MHFYCEEMYSYIIFSLDSFIRESQSTTSFVIEFFSEKSFIRNLFLNRDLFQGLTMDGQCVK